ncbi:MAG: hemerythrin domain-containing protein [Bryobacteraceae bacterium]|nr:hemerythrin domain-containing protein [Bryobacteraceae bacterium]
MNLVDALLGEHAVIRGMLSRLVRECKDRPAHWTSAALTMLEDALGSHAAIEDELLFDGLLTRKTGVSSALESMRGEHAAIREGLAGLTRAPANLIRGQMEQFAELVLEHFAVEERVLFPLAQSLLSAEELQTAGRQWAKRRGVQQGSPVA